MVGDELLLGESGVHKKVNDEDTALAFADTYMRQAGDSLFLHLVEVNIVGGGPAYY